MASLLRAVRVDDRVLEIMSKTAASATFVALGATRWTTGDVIGAWFLAALVLCAIGDFLLLGKRSFDAGLLAFLLGHALYIVGFGSAQPFGTWSWTILAPIVVAAGGAITWLWPHLGKRRVPVVAYIVTISVMLWGAFSGVIHSTMPWTAAAGASLFSLSDLAVARHRFVHESFINRALGLPPYYFGQFLLAMTIGTG